MERGCSSTDSIASKDDSRYEKISKRSRPAHHFLCPQNNWTQTSKRISATSASDDDETLHPNYPTVQNWCYFPLFTWRLTWAFLAPPLLFVWRKDTKIANTLPKQPCLSAIVCKNGLLKPTQEKTTKPFISLSLTLSPSLICLSLSLSLSLGQVCDLLQVLQEHHLILHQTKNHSRNLEPNLSEAESFNKPILNVPSQGPLSWWLLRTKSYLSRHTWPPRPGFCRNSVKPWSINKDPVLLAKRIIARLWRSVNFSICFFHTTYFTTRLSYWKFYSEFIKSWST